MGIGRISPSNYLLWLTRREAPSMTFKLVLLDAALVLFAHFLNGLRDSSISSLLPSDFAVYEGYITSRFCLIKDRLNNRQPSVIYRLISFSLFSVDPWLCWAPNWGRYTCFVVIDGELNRLPDETF